MATTSLNIVQRLGGGNTNDALCDFPGMEIGCGRFVRRSCRRIYGPFFYFASCTLAY